MPVGFPSLRVDQSNDTHHLWCNNGTWWIHYTVHFDHRVRRVRQSLKTRSLSVAKTRRDALLAQVSVDGQFVPELRAVVSLTTPTQDQAGHPPAGTVGAACSPRMMMQREVRS